MKQAKTQMTYKTEHLCDQGFSAYVDDYSLNHMTKLETFNFYTRLFWSLRELTLKEKNIFKQLALYSNSHCAVMTSP